MEQLLVISSALLWIVVLFNLLLTLALVRRLNSTSSRNRPDFLRMGQPAPNFTAESLSGERVTLSTYANHVVAFIFVSPGCQPCREEISILEALRPKADRSGVELVLVSIADTEETRAFVDEIHISLPTLVAPQGSNPFMRDYRVGGTPFFCLLDADQTVMGVGFGGLENVIRKTLKEKWTSDSTTLLQASAERA